jgi:hypothetical protein
MLGAVTLAGADGGGGGAHRYERRLEIRVLPSTDIRVETSPTSSSIPTVAERALLIAGLAKSRSW